MTELELVADLRSADPALAADVVRRWSAADPTGSFLQRALFVVPANATITATLPAAWRTVSGAAPGLWDSALAAAGRDRRAVLTAIGPILPCLEAAGVMLDLLESDPMFGAVVARTQCSRGCCIQPLIVKTVADAEWLMYECLGNLQAHDLVGDVLAPMTLVKPLLLTEFGDVDPPFESLAGTLQHRIASARRCGFRTVAANRAVVTLGDGDCTAKPAPVTMPQTDAKRLDTFENDADREWREFRGGSADRFERLTGKHVAALRGTRPSLLLDMRNLGATFNGTSFAALGVAGGLLQAGVEWDVAILANEDGAGFHELDRTFPDWRLYTKLPREGFNVALRLSQPWHIQEMVDLHQLARLNAYLMLDTICWDVIYVAPPFLDGTWRFLSEFADHLLFISDFSRRRFHARFPADHRISDAVCHLSFDPRDYIRPEVKEREPSDYVLIIGNHLDHKDVAVTADLVASAFPMLRIESLGPTRWRSPRVTAHKSGKLAELEVQQLYANASLAIFPSFYEGFGLPIVTALAYGRTLLARQSALIDEIAAHCQPNGRLITYRDRDELVDVMGRLRHDQPVADRPLGLAGVAIDRAPRSWKEVGLQVDQELRQLMRRARADDWRRRDHQVRQALAFKS